MTMDRREFLGTAALAGAGIAISGREVVAGTPDVPLEEATVTSLQAAMVSGQATAKSIAQGYLARIADIDKKLNSIIELNPDALAIANQMDKERKAGKVRGPLHGIPVVIKEIGRASCRERV